MTAALEGGERSAARTGRTLPPGKTHYPFYWRLGGPKGRSGRAENLVFTGIRSRTVQPVVSRCTDWSTRLTLHTVKLLNSKTLNLLSSEWMWHISKHDISPSISFKVFSAGNIKFAVFSEYNQQNETFLEFIYFCKTLRASYRNK